MTDSTMSKMRKGKQPKQTAQAKAELKKSFGLTAKQKTLPEALKKKIIESKKSGAGYSGSYN